MLFVRGFLKKRAAERQSSLPVISQAVKYSRRHFCSDSIKGLPPYPLYSHSQPAPSGEGWRFQTTLTCQEKQKKAFHGLGCYS